MSPINPNTCVRLQFPGTPKHYSPKSYYGKHSPRDSNLPPILKSNGGIRKMAQAPVDKKKVRFAVPLDDSFKGFVTDYSNQLEDKRYKITTIMKNCVAKKRTTVRECARATPAKIWNKKGFLSTKKFCKKSVANQKEIKDDSSGTISQPGNSLRNNLKPAQMVMMQCKVCARKAFFPKKPQHICNANSFICNDCFLKSKSMMFKTSNPFASNAVDKTVLPEIRSVDNNEDQIEDKTIIITSVRSLATQNSQGCQDQSTTPNLEAIDMEPVSSRQKNEETEDIGVKDRNCIVKASDDHDENNAKVKSGQGKTVNVWTSEGYFTFVVPNQFEHQTDQFKLVCGQKRGTEDDPIVVDDC